MGNDAFRPRTTNTRLSLPFNGTIYRTTREVASEKPLPVIGDTMAAELGPAFATSRIIAVTDGPDRSKGILTIDHATIPTEEEQLPTNWEYSTCDIGGRNFDSVTRTVIMLASAEAHDTPATGSPMPHETGSIFTGKGYILADRQAIKIGLNLEPVFRAEVRSYVKKTTMTQIDLDEQLGGTLRTIQTLYYDTEIVPNTGISAEALFAASNHTFWGLQTNGTSNEGKQLSSRWYAITTRDVVPASFAVSGRSYNTTMDFSWPAVLSSVQIDIWPRKDGGEDNFARPILAKEAYRGPCRAIVSETFSKTAAAIIPPQVLLPLPIDISTPLFSLSLGPTLHEADSIMITTGTTHPVYDYTAGSIAIVGTNETDWPAFITASDEQTPFRGGYLRTIVTIYPPS